MKKIWSILFLMGFSLVLVSQDLIEEPPKRIYTQQIGMDISTLVSNLLDPDISSNIIFSPTYILTYKSIYNGRAFRAGFGGKLINEVSDDDPDEKIKDNSFRIRMGFEKQIQVSNRWLYSVGMDFKFSTNQFENQDTEFKSDTKLYSLSPLFGVQFKITPHLYLQTEASFNLYYTTNSFTTFNFSSFPSVMSKADIKSIGGNLSIPNALQLVIQF